MPRRLIDLSRIAPVLIYEFVTHTMHDVTELWLLVVKFDILNETLEACFYGTIAISYNFSFYQEVTYIHR